MKGQPRQRAAALLEVLGVYVAGPFLLSGLRRLSGISITNPLNTLSGHATNAELITASRQMLVLMIFQYAGWFLLIVPINWWHRRRGLAAYGLTRAGRSWKALLLAGLGAAALAEWPVLSVSFVNSIHPSTTAPWRQAFFEMSWRRWEFWLFSAILSWAVVPVAEELFYRGYYQRRLAEDWGDGPAIFGTACLFTFAHTQYQVANAYSVGMIVGLFTFAVGMGVVFAWTRSLIPSTVAHAIINVPMTSMWQGVLLAAFVIGAVALWRRGVSVFKQVFAMATATACAALAVVETGYVLVAARVERLEYVAAGMVVLAIGLEAMDRRREAAQRQTVA